MKAGISQTQDGPPEDTIFTGSSRMTEQQRYLQFLGAVLGKSYVEMVTSVISSPKSREIAA